MFKKFYKGIFRKPLKTWVLFIIFISFIVKLFLGYSVRESFFRRGNSHTPMNAIALNIKDNLEFAIEPGIPSIDYEPIYPMILGISYRIFGKSWFGVTLIQAILYGITSWLLFLIGTSLKDELAGFIAALYHSFYPYLFSHGVSVFDTTQFIFIMILLVYTVLIKTKKDEKYWDYFIIGILLGFSLLSRGSAIAFWPPIIVFLVIKRSHLNIIKRAGITIIVLFIILAPWLIRNYILSGSLIISTHGGFGFWQGNNEYTYNYLKSNISLDEIYRRVPPPEIYQKYPVKPRYPKEAIKVSNMYTSEAIQFIKENPKKFIRLCGLKFIKFWSWIRNPASSTYSFGSKKLRQYAYFISYFPLLLGFPFGVYILYKKSLINLILLSGMLLTYTFAHMVIMGFTRARLPLDPILMLFFGIIFSKIIKSNFKFNKVNI